MDQPHQPGFDNHHVEQQGANSPAITRCPGLPDQPQLAHHSSANHLLFAAAAALLQQPQQVRAPVLNRHSPHLVFDAAANYPSQY